MDLSFLIIKLAVTVAFKAFVTDLGFEFLAHALIFGQLTNPAGTVAVFCL